MTAAAARMRLMRERLARGRKLLLVEFDAEHLPFALSEAGLLPAWSEGDPDAVRRAVERLLDMLCRMADTDALAEALRARRDT